LSKGRITKTLNQCRVSHQWLGDSRTREDIVQLKKLPVHTGLIALFLALTLLLDGTPHDGAPVGPRVSASSGAQPALPLMASQADSPSHDTLLVTTVTISGTITDPSGPAKGIRVSVGSPQEWQETATDASGAYRVTLQTDGQIWISVRPDIASRLAQANYWTDGVTTNRTFNFTLVRGHLLSLRVTAGGAPLAYPIEPWLMPLIASLSDGHYYQLDWDPTSRRAQAVLPPDIYYATVENPPAGYYRTSQPCDLRSADRTADLALNTTFVHPIPYDPPVASKISVGPPDDLGEAAITGAPGAALPLARVLLVNLNSTHQAHTTSRADGSFSARIYAPPGSALMVKHGPASDRWRDLDAGVAEGLNPFPGTILNVPHAHAGGPYSLPFAAAGAIHSVADDSSATRNYVGSAWSITGTAGPLVVDGEWARELTGIYEGQTVPGLYLGGLNWTHPSLGDLDADGDLELLVGERSGHLVLYRNNGTRSSPDWRFETARYAGVDTGDWAYPALADLTGDGALDLVVGAGRQSVSIYYNDGTSASPVWPAAPDVALSTGWNAAPALDDLDGDGDRDLLVGHAGGTLEYWQNTGTPTAPAWTLRSTQYGGIDESGASDGVQPAFIDLDGDGDRDLLLGLCGQMVWYRRGGTVRNLTWARVGADPVGYGGGSCATSPGAGDWDGDGDLDLVTGEHLGTTRAFRRGPGSWSNETILLPFDLLADSAPALADWDNDGDLDMLVGQAHGNVHRYTNVGSAAQPAWRDDGVELTLPWTNHPHPIPALADIAGDGDHDLFIGEGSWADPGVGGTIHYYNNAGNPASPDWRLVTDNWLGLDVGDWSMPAFADIDGDGDQDLFVGDGAGTLTFVENTGTRTAPRWAAPIHPYADLNLGNYGAPSFIDLDQDGDLDMLIGRENGSLAYVRNTGTARSPAWKLVSTRYPPIQIGEHATPATADLNGDGKADLLVGDGDGGLNLYHYLGKGTPPSSKDEYLPGDTIQIEGTLRLHSPAITAHTDLADIVAVANPSLLMLHDETGAPRAAQSSVQSTMLTPSGLPVLSTGRPEIGLHQGFAVTGFRRAGDHALESGFIASIQLPADLPAGTYRPQVRLDVRGVPTNTDWLAAYVTAFTYDPQTAALPPIRVGQPATGRQIWRLLMDDIVQGTRGAGARADQGAYGLSAQIVTQGAPFHVPPIDTRTGQAITYRLEPFLPMLSYTDRRMPAAPLVPLDLPGGQLCVAVHKPDGSRQDLGCEPFAQSFNRTKTTREGNDLNVGTVQLEDVYSLMATTDRFRTTFDQYGLHTIVMSGTVSDPWGNRYVGGGTYDLWVAHTLDVDSGVLPGTPLAAGDAYHPTFQFYPRVPAQVSLTLTHYPGSDPSQAITRRRSGQANAYGYYAGSPIRLATPGEYRVDATAVYTNPSGMLYVGATTWGSVVMTPPDQAPHLVAHGRRGLDSLAAIPGSPWFVSCRDLPIDAGAISHTFNPFFNGDLVWSRMIDAPGECPAGVTSGGDSLILGASVQDTVGVVEAAILARAQRIRVETYGPGTLTERAAAGELPLFISTRSGRPPPLDLTRIGAELPGDVDQIAYSYRSSQRPGVRVREVVAEDGESGGYWRLDTLYDDQLGVGILGDQPNDYKFQYLGVVYRDLDTGRSEYLGHGSGWIFIPDSDRAGTRVMPPFAGPGNGGWTTEGGPILTLKGKAVHAFVLPTGTRPGAVLETGDMFRFAGHVMPTLDSRVAVTLTAPSGQRHLLGGQANSVGYYADPGDDLPVNEAGLWSVDVRVWHDGRCSGGQTVPPYPSGDVLGSTDGRYWFYVVPPGTESLDVSSPTPGWLTWNHAVTPIEIQGSVPEGLDDVTVEYTISMPGYILQRGQVTPAGGAYRFIFDPEALQRDYPNLDLTGRDTWRAGLADTISIGLLLRGRQGGQTVYRANTITFQGDQVYVGGVGLGSSPPVYLPLVLKDADP
jgi:hypothetical protein